MVVLLLLFCLVVLPAIVAVLLSPAEEEQSVGGLHVGDRIVYCKQKASTHPGPRAREVYPAPFGETYSYLVEKFWKVEDLLDDGRIIVTTRRHKRHCLSPDDLNLHKAGWIETLRHWSRFPKANESD